MYEVTLPLGKMADSQRALLTAAQEGQLDAVKQFIGEKKINIATKDQSGMTALHLASGNGHLKVVKWLTEAGANVQAKTEDTGSMPIHLAASFGHLSVVKFFIEEIDEAISYWKDGDGLIPMFNAAYKGQLEVVKYFITDKQVHPDMRDDDLGITVLHIACLLGYSDLVKWLIGAGANVKAISNTIQYNSMPIHFAAENGNVAVVKYFVEEIDEAMTYWKNSDGTIPMLRAALAGKLDVLKYFITKRNVNIDTKDDRLGRTAMHYASHDGNIEIVKWLIQAGADVKAKSFDDDGNNMPIHVAARFGHLELVKFFIEEIDAHMMYWKNGNGIIPMRIADSNGKHDVVEYFIRKGVDVDEGLPSATLTLVDGKYVVSDSTPGFLSSEYLNDFAAELNTRLNKKRRCCLIL